MTAKLRTRNIDQLVIFSSDELIPEEHEARDLLAYIQDSNLDECLASIKSRKGGPGAPAFDPRVLLSLWLYAMSKGVGSARELSQLCKESHPYRWLCGDDAPNYHTLSDFRITQGELMDRLLTDNLAVLHSEGLLQIEGMTVAHDGMRVRTAAGRGSFRRQQRLEEAKKLAEQRVEELKNDVHSPTTTKRKQAARERAARERKERVERAIEQMKEMHTKHRKKDRAEPRVSTTDPDARRMKMANGGIDPAYNIQLTTDTKARIITAVDVAECGSDYGEITAAMEQHKRRLGARPGAVMFDLGFTKMDDIIALEASGIKVFAPDQYGKNKVRKNDPHLARWSRRMKKQANRDLYAKTRCSTAELTNARMRQRGFYFITVRGRKKAKIIATLHALTHNILETIKMRKGVVPAA